MKESRREEEEQCLYFSVEAVLPADPGAQLQDAMSSESLNAKGLDEMFFKTSVVQRRVLLLQCMTDISTLTKRNELN